MSFHALPRRSLILIAALVFTGACAGPESQPPAVEQPPPMDTLVTTDWLDQHLDDPDLVVLDCSVRIEMEAGGGYEVSSGYTMVKNRETCRFVYRKSVWRGCDLLGMGVASFSHLSGVHFQNVDGWGEYLAKLAGFGIVADAGQIFSSSTATAD